LPEEVLDKIENEDEGLDFITSLVKKAFLTK
jgi:hypothetical protein